MAIIVGAPPRAAHDANLPLHHTLGDYDIPRQMFEKVTVGNGVIVHPVDAPAEIDRVLSLMIQRQQPVYLSFPTDVVCQPCGVSKLGPFENTPIGSEKFALAEGALQFA